MGNGPKLDPNNLDASFLSPAALNKSGNGAAALAGLDAVRAAAGAGGRLWAGETAAANDGGQTGITDSYIDGFWYLDQVLTKSVFEMTNVVHLTHAVHACDAAGQPCRSQCHGVPTTSLCEQRWLPNDPIVNYQRRAIAATASRLL